jgi:hypothetical protein
VALDPSAAEALMRRTGRPGLSEEKIQGVLESAHASLGVPCLAPERELLQWLGTEVLAASTLEQRMNRSFRLRLL